jgi:hypothetical protein
MKAFSAATLVLLLSSGAAAAEPAFKVSDLAWMTGSWVQQDRDYTVRETWLPPSGDQMVGLSQESRAGRQPFYEFERIEGGNGVIAFTAILEGQAPTDFVLKSATDGEVVFENLAHDFPQRVIYRRCGEDLCARIEGLAGGKPRSQDWRYRRAAP